MSVSVGKTQNLEVVRVCHIKKMGMSVSVSVVRFVKFGLSVSVSIVRCVNLKADTDSNTYFSILLLSFVR